MDSTTLPSQLPFLYEMQLVLRPISIISGISFQIPWNPLLNKEKLKVYLIERNIMPNMGMGSDSDNNTKNCGENILSVKMKDILNIHNYYFPKFIFEKNFKDLVVPLLNVFDDTSGFSLFVDENNKEYYSSVTSTIFIALYHMKLTDEIFKNKICETIFNLKDNKYNRTVKEKIPEDYDAWDVSEGANCWTTSLVIESLLETGYSGNKIDIVRNAIIWLKDQQRPDDGWGFDKQGESRVLFTARAIYALYLGKELFESDSSRQKDIERAIDLGITFIKKLRKVDKNFAYWSIETDSNEPDPTNTALALWILNKFDLLDNDLKEKSLNYLKKDLQNREIWDFREVIKESDTKYGSHKIITSFTPCIPLVLLDLGVEPFDELCMKPICWLRKNFNDGWILPSYKNENLTFVYALGLWTLMRWQKEITNRIMLSNIENKTFIGLRKRIKLLIYAAVLLLLFIAKGYLFNLYNTIYTIICDFYTQQGLIIALATFLSIAAALFGIPKGIIYLDQKLLTLTPQDWGIIIINTVSCYR